MTTPTDPPPTNPPQSPGPYGANPYGQPVPPSYGWQGQFGAPGGPPRPPKNRGKIVAIVLVAVIVLVGAGVGVYFLTKSDDGGNGSGGGPAASSVAPVDPNDPAAKAEVLAVAQRYVDAINRQDAAAATQEVCGKTDPWALYETFAGEGFEVGLTEDQVEIGENGAFATVPYTLDGEPASTQVPLPLRKEASWCIGG